MPGTPAKSGVRASASASALVTTWQGSIVVRSRVVAVGEAATTPPAMTAPIVIIPATPPAATWESLPPRSSDIPGRRVTKSGVSFRSGAARRRQDDPSVHARHAKATYDSRDHQWGA